MGYYNDDGQWMEGNAPPAQPRRMPRQMRPAEERQNDPNQGVRRQARRELTQERYDDDGNLIPAQPLNTEETLDDVRRSIPTGVQRGIASTIGQRGDISDLRENLRESIDLPAIGDAINEYGQMVIDPLYGVERAIEAVTGSRPTSSAQVNEGFENVFGEQYEPRTTAGEFARTFGEFLPTALIPTQRANQVATNVVERGAQMAGNAVRQVATQAAAPAVASEALGQLTEGTDAEGPARLVGALLGAGVSEGTINFLTRQGLTPDKRALRLIRRELANAGYAPEEIARVANRLTAQAPTEEVLGELMGPSGRRLMRATAAMGQGGGRSAAENTFNARATGRQGPVTSTDPNRRGVTSIRDRVTAEAARTFAPEQTHSPNNYWDHIDTLRNARRGQAADNYRTAYASSIDQTLAQDHLTPLMVEAPDAARSGARQLEFEERRLLGERSQLTAGANNVDAERLARVDADIADVRAARAQLDAIGNGEPPREVNVRAIDYFQRGLQQAEQNAGRGSPEAGAIASFRHGFNGLADQIAPALGDTRSQYGRSMAIEEFTEMGRRVFNMSEGEIDRALRGPSGRGLTTEEFDGFQLGVLDAIENRLGQGDTAFLARLERNANWRAQLERAAGGQAEARRFMTRLAREAAMQRTRNEVLSGSRTTPLSEDIAALTTGENEFSFLADAGGVQNFVSRVSAGAKNPMDAAWRVATWLWDRYNRPGIANPEVQQAMARRLFSRVTREGSKELRDALLTLPENPNAHPELRTFVRSLIAVNGGDEGPEADVREVGGEAAIDASRPILENPDGSFSTEQTITIEADGRFYNIPTIWNGQRLSEDDAVALWRRGGNPEVGVFGSQAEAEEAARSRSARIGQVRAGDR